VACGLCGGGDAWIKSCLTTSGSRILVCDPCHGEHRSELTVVTGDRLVTARCGSCGIYGNPREFSGLSLGGRRGVYLGTCGTCASEEGS
jgi:hypothetical protein